ncbi:YxiF family protein [Bacillus subtilis]|uniref:YxiF family protein n=1 Tax=Bacillus subtilis TaxID=1423 RepID=UPI0020B2E489|nr:hypothetical protein [Bacillus subtilis]
MNNERVKKMELLKRKSRRKNLIRELDFLHITEDSFLDIEENELFCKKAFSILDTKQNKVQIQGTDYIENIQKSIQLLKDTFEIVELGSNEARLLFFRENEIEAVLLSLDEIFINLDKVLEITKFSIGYGDFILTSEDFKFGLCIERTEYHYEFCVWGLSEKNKK